MGEVAANADGEGKVCLKIITSQAVPPPALLRGEPLMLYKSLYWSLFDKFFDIQKFRGMISTEFFVMLYQSKKEMIVAIALETIRPARIQQRVLTQNLVFLFIFFISFRISYRYQMRAEEQRDRCREWSCRMRGSSASYIPWSTPRGSCRSRRAAYCPSSWS